MTSSLDGSKLGREVGEFYKSLVDNGVPEEEALKMTNKYFEKRLEVTTKLNNLVGLLEKLASRPSGPGSPKGEIADMIEEISKV